MTRALKNRLKSTASTVANAAIWLWKLPPVRDGARTVLVRIGLGAGATAIITAIADGLAR